MAIAYTTKLLGRVGQPESRTGMRVQPAKPTLLDHDATQREVSEYEGENVVTLLSSGR